MFCFIPTRRVIENSKKIANQFKKLKNTTMALFQAKIGWIRQKKGENKNCRSVSFRSYTTRNRKFQKNSNKIIKIKKYHYGLISSQNWQEKAERERKLKLSFRFVHTLRIIENSKKIAKKFKKLKNTIMALFQAKIGWKRLRKTENKN